MSIPRKKGPPSAREPQTDLGRRIRQARRARKFSQARLAIRLGVLQPVVSQWELGDHKPNEQKLEQLADALDVTVEWLVDGEMPCPLEKEPRTWP